MKKIIRQLVFYLWLIALWQVVADLKAWPPYLFPPPRDVFDALQTGFADKTFLIGLGISMKRIALGYGLSVLLGVVLGFMIAANEFLEATLGGAGAEPAKPAQPLLVAAGRALVRTE